jgi:hypothetical protein
MAPQAPSPPHQDDANNEVDDDDAPVDVDVDAYINTGAEKGMYMPPLDEEP